MTAKGFSNELARALARPDVEHLLIALEQYHAWHQGLLRKEAGEDVDDRDIYIDEVIYDLDDPERSLALAVLATANYDDPRFIGLVAAGPLEDMFTNIPGVDRVTASNDLLHRVVVEARRTPRFRWMLSGVWTYSMPSDIAKTIADAVGNVSMDTDPLPPRPWA